MSKRNVFYAQSGGATAVINATACGLIQTAHLYPKQIGTVYAGHNGILGALKEELIDTSQELPETIEALKTTPACAFGSCRYRMKDIEKDDSEYRRLIDVFAAHDIGYFFYNGGGDSQDTAHKVSMLSAKLNYPLTCIGLPKTIDNDLACTDNSPGFGSVAKYIATSVKETALDVMSMCSTSTKVFILEVMGRHAGWIAASAGLSTSGEHKIPSTILFPEIPFNEATFLEKVKTDVESYGFAVIVVSEGVKDELGNYLHESRSTDAFGHEQLGGIAPILGRIIKQKLGYKNHYAVADYMQRAARHIASATDAEQAYALGKSAIEMALEGKNNVMLTINRLSSATYAWDIGTAPLNEVANIETKMPRNYITEDGFGITKACHEYLAPLIQGEAHPPYKNGLPSYARLKKVLIPKKLDNGFDFVTLQSTHATQSSQTQKGQSSP